MNKSGLTAESSSILQKFRIAAWHIFFKNRSNEIRSNEIRIRQELP